MEGSSNGEGMSGGPKNPQQAAAQRRLQQTQAQVDEVVGIMRMNVEKVIERDQKLSELDDRADALQQGASQFEQQAGKLKRKFWWKNLKMMIIMGIIGLIIIIIIGASYEYQVDYATAERYVMTVVFEESEHNVTGESSKSKSITPQPYLKSKSTTTTPLLLEEHTVDHGDETEDLPDNVPSTLNVLSPPNRKIWKGRGNGKK